MLYFSASLAIKGFLDSQREEGCKQLAMKCPLVKKSFFSISGQFILSGTHLPLKI
jgi:hypothetical protein